MQNSSFDYQFGRPLTRWVKYALILLASVFLLQLISKKFLNLPLENMFGLVPALIVRKFFLWQFFTYPFLHASISHLILNGLTLWLFGSTLEERLGSRQFITFFLLSCWVAGIFNFLVNVLFFPEAMFNPIIGSSAGNYGILMAFALFDGEQVMFPFPLKAKYFVLALGIIEMISAIFYDDGIAHLAHLGGLIFAYFYIQYRFIKPLKFSHKNQGQKMKSFLKKEKGHLRLIQKDDDENPKTWH